jgi:hypothetical protein
MVISYVVAGHSVYHYGPTGQSLLRPAASPGVTIRPKPALRRFQEGNEAALRELANFRAKPLTGDLAGWTELDLLPGNPGPLNQMRMLIRIDAGGNIEPRLLQMH